MDNKDVSKVGVRMALDWIKESGLLAITVIGFGLYFFLSIPATLFYSRLGTTPGEVGITYVNLLSGSTFELLIIFISLASAILIAGFLVAYVLMTGYAFFLYPRYFWSRPGVGERDRLTREIDRNLKIYRRIPEYFQTRRMFWPDYPATIKDVEIMIAQRLALLKITDRTPEQAAQLARLEGQLVFPKKARIRKDLARTVVTLVLMIRRRVRRLVLPFTLIIVVLVLPILAFIQAGQVRDGHTYFASGSGIFDYSADPVAVHPATPDSATAAISNLTAKKLFLLGENTAYAVLYSPTDGATIRVPIASVVISSVRG